MYYFEHYLRAAGIKQLRRAAILPVTGAEWLYDDLRCELLDAFPEVTVDIADAVEPPARCDLIVLPLVAGPEFPFHDVLYEHLAQTHRLGALRERAGYLMIYRAGWREVEVIPSNAFPRWLRARRIEGRLIRACRRSAILRRILRPRYPF